MRCTQEWIQFLGDAGERYHLEKDIMQPLAANVRLLETECVMRCHPMGRTLASRRHHVALTCHPLSLRHHDAISARRCVAMFDACNVGAADVTMWKKRRALFGADSKPRPDGPGAV